ncbi:MAG: phosphomannomutase/phosphoglucomutase [Halioglobus sp.]|nr:phosphomannomutase/phosphoglucomutase [Halioglobus sp.]
MLKLKKSKKNDAGETNTMVAGSSAPQGIAAKGNSLRSIGALILMLLLLASILGFAYLLLLREPALQKQQVERVATSFAEQQAINIQRLITHLEIRVISAAQSALALSAIASGTDEDMSLVETTLLDFFPEVIGLRVIPIGDLGTADFSGGNRGLRNHIEVDLVRRASEGEATQPEAYKFENAWLTSMAARLKHPRVTDRWAVIFITLDNAWLSSELIALDANGRFTLEQGYSGPTGRQQFRVVAANGSASSDTITRYVAVPDTSWRVSFTPSDSLLSALKVSPTPLYAVLALMITASIVSVALLLLMFPRKLAREVSRVISAADDKTDLKLSIPELVPIAKQLRRATLRALRQSSSSSWDTPLPDAESVAEPTDDLTNPLFQAAEILDQHDSTDMGLELHEAADVASNLTMPSAFPEHIFRAYDIRGHGETELTDDLIMEIGKAVGSIAEEHGEQGFIVGGDGRLSTPRIKSTLIQALLSTGRDVTDIGLVPTPLLYFATRHLGSRSGIMITGSHNPAEHNGLKIVLNQQTIAAGGIKAVCERISSQQYTNGTGRATQEDIIPAYMEEVLHDIAIAVPLKIVVDAGNGATGELAPTLLEALGCEVERLNCEIDGRFPGRSPDTSNEQNLADLATRVVDVRADFGVAFDGDGDRLAVVTPSGRIVRSDILLMLYAQDVVSRNPGADVVFDVKCSRQLSTLITQHGGRPVLWKTGHAFMKEKMQETGALLGGEFSGHMFFGERWYGFDDGLYAACRLAEILSTHGESLDDCIADFPLTVNTPEITIPVPDDYKFELVDKIIKNADFSSGKVNTMDGIRVDFSNGWGLVRASNTGPALTARFEADTQENLDIIRDEFRAQIALVDSEIELNF